MPACRFPPPWFIEKLNDACFIVKDNDGQQLAYGVYFNDPRSAAKPLTRDEARRITERYPYRLRGRDPNLIRLTAELAGHRA